MSEFRLQTVLRVRQQREDQAQQYLAQAQRQQQSLHAQMQAEQERLSTLHQEMRHLQAGGMDPQTLQLFEQCIQACRQCCRDLVKDVAQAEQNVQARQSELFEACRDKKVVEKLKDRQEERRLEEIRQADNALMDEIASGTVAREMALAGGNQ
jgi:flagellar FliJ protein